MELMPFESDLDKLSNSVLDQIEARNYDEAEKLCQRLLVGYPEVIDGHERLAAVREAQGRFEEAASEYFTVLEMMSQQRGFDSGMVTYITERRDRALAKVKRQGRLRGASPRRSAAGLPANEHLNFDQLVTKTTAKSRIFRDKKWGSLHVSCARRQLYRLVCKYPLRVEPDDCGTIFHESACPCYAR